MFENNKTYFITSYKSHKYGGRNELDIGFSRILEFLSDEYNFLLISFKNAISPSLDISLPMLSINHKVVNKKNYIDTIVGNLFRANIVIIYISPFDSEENDFLIKESLSLVRNKTTASIVILSHSEVPKYLFHYDEKIQIGMNDNGEFSIINSTGGIITIEAFKKSYIRDKKISDIFGDI